MPKPKVKFADAGNPTPDEIRKWAGCNDLEPMEDWDLVLATPEHAGVLIDLVADEACPSRRYLLGALYVLIGDAVRSAHRSVPAADLERLLAKARASGNSWLVVWADRSEHLMANPDEFEYAAWCAGGLAKRPMN